MLPCPRVVLHTMDTTITHILRHVAQKQPHDFHETLGHCSKQHKGK